MDKTRITNANKQHARRSAGAGEIKEINMSDLIDRQAAIDDIWTVSPLAPLDREWIDRWLRQLPPANTSETPNSSDTISRQAAIDAVRRSEALDRAFGYGHAVDALRELPSAQPERRCVNCGRTVNNGGWYEDGRTRCPIEEHYALPKDGYCHLWEKRKDWEDDYVKRAEEGEK